MSGAGSYAGAREGPPRALLLRGPWGELSIEVGTPDSADLTIELASQRRVGVALREGRAVVPPLGGRQVGLIRRAVLAAHVGRWGGVVLHAAAVADAAGDTTLFLGPSGAGKTTVSTQAQGALIGDDTVVVWPEEDALVVLATPFVSENGRPAEVERGRPTAVATLSWGAPAVAPLERRDTLQALVRSVYAPPDPSVRTETMATILRLAEIVDGYRLTFPKDFRLGPGGLRSLLPHGSGLREQGKGQGLVEG